MMDKAKVVEIDGTDMIGVEVGGDYVAIKTWATTAEMKAAISYARAYAEGWNAAMAHVQVEVTE